MKLYCPRCWWEGLREECLVSAYYPDCRLPACPRCGAVRNGLRQLDPFITYDGRSVFDLAGLVENPPHEMVYDLLIEHGFEEEAVVFRESLIGRDIVIRGRAARPYPSG